MKTLKSPKVENDSSILDSDKEILKLQTQIEEFKAENEYLREQLRLKENVFNSRDIVVSPHKIHTGKDSNFSTPVSYNKYKDFELERQYFQAQIDSLKLQIDSITSSNHFSKFMMKITNFLDVEYDSKVQNLMKECSKYQAEATLFKEKYDELKQENQSLNEKLTQMQESSLTIKNEFVNLQFQLSEQFQKYEEVNEILDKEREMYKRLLENYQKLEIEIKILEAEKRMSSNTIVAINELRDQLKMKSDVINIQKEELQKYKHALVKEVERGESMRKVLQSVTPQPKRSPMSKQTLSRLFSPKSPIYNESMKENIDSVLNTYVSPVSRKQQTSSPMSYILKGKSSSGKVSTPKSQKKSSTKSRSFFFKNRSPKAE